MDADLLVIVPVVSMVVVVVEVAAAGSRVAEASTYLTRRMIDCVYVHVSRAGLDRLNHFGEARRTSVNALTTDNG